MINAPVLHVNGDHPQGKSITNFWGRTFNWLVDVARAIDVAFKYRNYFRKVLFPLIDDRPSFHPHPPSLGCDY